MTISLYDRLIREKDDIYREFQIKLIPNIPPQKIIGVRTPQLRALAKEVAESEIRDAFLRDLPHAYYEENLIHFFILAGIRDFDRCVQEVDVFLPHADCWPVSDQATPACFRKNHPRLLPHIKKWIASEHVYTARFGIRILMNEFLGDDFREEYLKLAASKTGEDYYLKMMIAWYFATALAKRYTETLPYLEDHRLEEWTHKKAIQKALESYRITDAQKEYLKGLKTELYLKLEDTEWPCEYTDHDRRIARAIVFDEAGYYYFSHLEWDDDFGRASLIETSGGGVEEGESLSSAIRRELKEELGADVRIIGRIGLVSDYYNLIHRHNLNHYFLCEALSFGKNELTRDESERFHLTTRKLRFEEAVREYEKQQDSRLGRLVARRELPILRRAEEMIRLRQSAHPREERNDGGHTN